MMQHHLPVDHYERRRGELVRVRVCSCGGPSPCLDGLVVPAVVRRVAMTGSAR
ncbi:hypothetical protein [Actinorhabdospora filicis]|uniref:hypothetical protein n=1 Tax=Actinorhabdospora filicis TaxID=1785913 RepID=UPI0025553831|nr:hypothetical protein [Actinorhabdospora filicis]